MSSESLRAFVNTSGDRPVYFLGLPTLLRAAGASTGGAFGLVEHLTMPPGFASPYHTHRREDESFYVLEGTIAFIVDDVWTTVPAGGFVFGPRGIRHGFKVVGDAPARMLLLCTPAGFEQFVVQLGEAAPVPPDMAKLMALAAAYEIDIHGPLPEQAPSGV